MPQMTDEAGWLRKAFDGLEPAERSSLEHLLQPSQHPAGAGGRPLRSVAGTAGAFVLVVAASLLLGHPRP